MKISPENVKTIRDAIAPLVPYLAKHRAAIIAEGKAQDVEKRLRWDALWAAKIDGKRSCAWICDVLYPLGVKDSHVDTALRAIMIDLGVTSK
jgi:hypothetical protein